MKPVLLLDMDGPIADFDQAFFDMCQTRGYELDIGSLDDPNRKRFMTDNMVHSVQRKAARIAVDTRHWFKYLPVTPGAQEGIHTLEEHFDVWVCTKPLEVNPYCRDDKAAWLRRHFPQLEKKLIIAPDKSLVNGAVLLDDAPKLEWLHRALWEPVVFRSGFNGPDSQWAHLRHWSWGDSWYELLPECGCYTVHELGCQYA